MQDKQPSNHQPFSLGAGVVYSLSAIVVLATLVVSIAFSSRSMAIEPVRVWVDASGRHSVNARLLDIRDGKVVLLRQDGGEAMIAIDKLSEQDKRYVEEIRTLTKENPLRERPPQREPVAVQDRLDLEKADSVLPEDAELSLGAPVAFVGDLSLPESIDPDPSPDLAAVAVGRIPAGKVDAYDLCSPPVPILHNGVMSVAMSISNGFSMPGQTRSSQLVMFDIATGIARPVYRESAPIRLFDHHTASGRALVLVGHNPLGKAAKLPSPKTLRPSQRFS